MALNLPDVQACSPDIKINLTRVGVKNVKKLVEVARAGAKRPVVLISDFHLFVDLPSDIKGANMSRNLEAMYEVLEEAVSTSTYDVEELCSEVAKRLLLRHTYASTAEVGMKSEYMLKRKTPVMRISCQEPATIFAEARAFHTPSKDQKNGVRIKKVIGAEVAGMTTCPCAQELMREKALEELTKMGIAKEDSNAFLDNIPLATHNQRGRGIISIEVEDDVKVPLDKIIRIIEKSMSAKTYEILKRPDEARIVEMAHKKPMFVEDCVREMAKRVVETFKDLPDDSIVTITQINEESIHQHDAVAERVASIGELRRELEESKVNI
ncbi:MAG: GTP cyclohydrolase MptA [archaeon]|nr:GTP cyclohydrolase MptA [archaeon]